MDKEMRDLITVNILVPTRGGKHCEACGRFVNGRHMVSHANRDSHYVCNVMCGMKVCDE